MSVDQFGNFIIIISLILLAGVLIAMIALVTCVVRETCFPPPRAQDRVRVYAIDRQTGELTYLDDFAENPL